MRLRFLRPGGLPAALLSLMLLAAPSPAAARDKTGKTNPPTASPTPKSAVTAPVASHDASWAAGWNYGHDWMLHYRKAPPSDAQLSALAKRVAEGEGWDGARQARFTAGFKDAVNGLPGPSSSTGSASAASTAIDGATGTETSGGSSGTTTTFVGLTPDQALGGFIPLPLGGGEHSNSLDLGENPGGGSILNPGGDPEASRRKSLLDAVLSGELGAAPAAPAAPAASPAPAATTPPAATPAATPAPSPAASPKPSPAASPAPSPAATPAPTPATGTVP